MRKTLHIDKDKLQAVRSACGTATDADAWLAQLAAELGADYRHGQ
jgi:hypothetical protein